LQYLELGPRPLIFSQHNIVLSFSPKSACSHVIVWFLLKEGLLGAANYYHEWPHAFRTDVYYHTRVYKARAQKLIKSEGQGFTLIRVTRDPAKRLVSCYRHACRWNLIDHLVRRKVGIKPAEDGMSMMDYYTALRGEDLMLPSKVDVHACAQTHPVWKVGFDRIITLNVDETHLNPGLHAIEAELGLGHTHFDRHPKFDALRETHYATDTPHTGPEPVEALRIRRKQTGRFPKKQLEALPLVQQMTAELHGADLGHVQSGDSKGVLFQPGAATMKPAAAPVS